MGVRGEPPLIRVRLPDRDWQMCEIVASSSKWRSLWEYGGYTMTLGRAVEPYPDRYIVISKCSVSMMIFEITARRFWARNRNGTFEAPIQSGDYFRMDGKASPYTIEMLMKDAVRPRCLSALEAHFLAEHKKLGDFRVMADHLRGPA